MPTGPGNVLPQTALRELLGELLTEADLRQLLFDTYGPSMGDTLPWGGTRAELFFAAVDVLDRRGLIGIDLFRRLTFLAPGKNQRIRDVAARWGLGSLDPADPRIALVERLYRLVQAGDSQKVFTLVAEHRAAFFPNSDTDAQGWVTSYSARVEAERQVLVVEALRVRAWTSGVVRSTALALLDPQTPLLQFDASNQIRNGGWALSDASIAAIQNCLDATRGLVPSAQFGGQVNIYLGSRGQLDAHAKLMAWTAAKDVYIAQGVALRTTEGFVDQLATQALGEGWFALLPPESSLRRAT